MKITTITVALLVSLFSTVASAATMQDFAGAYEINTYFMGVEFQGNFNVEVDGKIKILASSSFLYLDCEGSSEMINDVLISTPVCENGMALSLKINLKNISNFSKFQAPVYSNILNLELPMDFKRL